MADLLLKQQLKNKYSETINNHQSSQLTALAFAFGMMINDESIKNFVDPGKFSDLEKWFQSNPTADCSYFDPEGRADISSIQSNVYDVMIDCSTSFWGSDFQIFQISEIKVVKDKHQNWMISDWDRIHVWGQ